ncbi:MAG: hypothetical protein K1W06_11685 [Lachnospiraceae bacterium]
MDWKESIEENADETCAFDIEEMIINNIKAGFLSDEEILEECAEYVAEYVKYDLKEDYPEDKDKFTKNILTGVIKDYRAKFQNTGTEENFLKLKLAFENIDKHGIVTQHCAGYTLSDGIDDCNEVADIRCKCGENIIGYCFYTTQDVEHLTLGVSSVLYMAFGSYTDNIDAVEIGKIIVTELENAGFSTEWDNSAGKRIAIKDIVWDKQYNEYN